MTVGEKIREARLKKGFTQAELAELLGYKSRSSINKIEVEGRDIPRSSIIKFAKALDVSPAYLMGWEDEEPKENSGKDELDIPGSTVGKRLKYIRTKKGIKVSEIAKELGISERAYRNYENNEQDLSTMTLLKICLFFNVSSEYILGIDDKTKSFSPAIDEKKALELKLESLSTDSLVELDKFMDYLLWKEEQ